MATVKFGAFVTGLKGKIGGTVFQGGKASYIAKNKPSWKNNYLLPQQTNEAGTILGSTKANLARIASMWRGLSDAQRLTWVNNAVNFPFKNRYGENYTPSGFQLYMSCNLNLIDMGQTVIENAPFANIPEPAFYPWPGGIVGGYYWEWGAWLQDNDFGCRISMAGPFSPGKQPPKGSYKAIYRGELPDTDNINLYAFAQARKGSFNYGGVVWYKWELIDYTSGLIFSTVYTHADSLPTPP